LADFSFRKSESQEKFSVTKIALATEELFAFYSKEQEVAPPSVLGAVVQSPS
jgi:hypothetical protein